MALCLHSTVNAFSGALDDVLLQPKAYDHEGFRLLTSLVHNLPQEQVDKYMDPAARLILTRMSTARTAKFTSCFITFICFLVGARGADFVAHLFER